jgi:hypothetical protein
MHFLPQRWKRCATQRPNTGRAATGFVSPIDRLRVHTQIVPKPNKKPQPKARPKKTEPAPELLKGWQQIASFLGQPVSVVQRWANEGMPVKKEGRFVSTTPAELNQWLGRESGEPVHVATPETDLSAELKRGLAHVRRERPDQKRGRAG